MTSNGTLPKSQISSGKKQGTSSQMCEEIDDDVFTNEVVPNPKSIKTEKVSSRQTVISIRRVIPRVT